MQELTVAAHPNSVQMQILKSVQNQGSTSCIIITTERML